MPVTHLHGEPLRARNLAQDIERLPRLDPADDREVGTGTGTQIGGLADLPVAGDRLDVGQPCGSNRSGLRRLGRLLGKGKTLAGAQRKQESGGKDWTAHGNGTFV